MLTTSMHRQLVVADAPVEAVAGWWRIPLHRRVMRGLTEGGGQLMMMLMYVQPRPTTMQNHTLCLRRKLCQYFRL